MARPLWFVCLVASVARAEPEPTQAAAVEQHLEKGELVTRLVMVELSTGERALVAKSAPTTLRWTRGGDALAFADAETVKLHRPDTKTTVTVLRAPTRGLTFSPDDAWLAMLGHGAVWVTNELTSPKPTLRRVAVHDSCLRAEWRSSTALLLSCEGEVRELDAVTGAVTRWPLALEPFEELVGVRAGEALFWSAERGLRRLGPKGVTGAWPPPDTSCVTPGPALLEADLVPLFQCVEDPPDPLIIFLWSLRAPRTRPLEWLNPAARQSRRPGWTPQGGWAVLVGRRTDPDDLGGELVVARTSAQKGRRVPGAAAYVQAALRPVRPSTP